MKYTHFRIGFHLLLVLISLYTFFTEGKEWTLFLLVSSVACIVIELSVLVFAHLDSKLETPEITIKTTPYERYVCLNTGTIFFKVAEGIYSDDGSCYIFYSSQDGEVLSIESECFQLNFVKEE